MHPWQPRILLHAQLWYNMYVGVVVEVVVYFLWFYYFVVTMWHWKWTSRPKSWESTCRRLIILSSRIHKLVVFTPHVAPMGSTKIEIKSGRKRKIHMVEAKEIYVYMKIEGFVSSIVQNKESVLSGRARSCYTKYTQYSLNSSVNILFNSYLFLLLTWSQPSRGWFLGTTNILNKLA